MTIDGTINYQQMGEDMVGEALFPTVSSYDTFPTSRYPLTSRLKGALDFDWYTSDALFPLIRWRTAGYEGPDDYLTGLQQVRINVEVSVAEIGARDIDGTANTAAHQIVVADLMRIRSVMREQLYDLDLGNGPFGIEDTVLVGGQGATPMSCVLDVEVGDDTVEQVQGDGESDNLGSGAWVGTLTVGIVIAH